MNAIPAYLTPALIAAAAKEDTRSVRSKIRRAGILEQDGPHRYQVAASRLRERLPEYYERVVGHLALGLNEDA